MIDELDDALRELLVRELPVKNNEVDIVFDQPKREWPARLSRPTATLYLHDIRESVKLRREQVSYELPANPDRIARLCALALHAGFDWVHNEINHCHASIRATSLCTVCRALAP